MPKKLKSDRFVVRQYASPETARSIAGGEGGAPLAWYPLVMAGADGRVTLPGFSPVAGQALRLIIDAHGDGRIESCELLGEVAAKVGLCAEAICGYTRMFGNRFSPQ